jgi:hypothetical protein
MVGLAVASRRRINWVAITLTATIACTITLQCARTAWHRYHGWSEPLREPSSRFTMNTGIENPLEHYSLLLSGSGKPLPIAILEPMDFLYLVNYAPGLAPRLYYINTQRDDFFVRSYANFRSLSPVRYNAQITSAELRQEYSHFYVFGGRQIEELPEFLKDGAEIKSLKMSKARFLAEVQVKNP